MLKGIDFGLEMKSSAWLRKLESGSVPQAGPQDGLLLGREIAFSIGAGPGDSVTVLTTASRLSPMGLFPKTKRFRVSGIFNTGLYEFDSSTALVPLETAQRFLGFEGKVTFLQVKISNIFEAENVGERIKEGLPPLAYVTTWMELNRSLFSALKLEKNIMFLTITLIVFVAALNIIATLILMVMEKTRDIGILMAMGATARQIREDLLPPGGLDRDRRDDPGRRSGSRLVLDGQYLPADQDPGGHIPDLLRPLPARGTRSHPHHRGQPGHQFPLDAFPIPPGRQNGPGRRVEI